MTRRLNASLLTLVALLGLAAPAAARDAKPPFPSIQTTDLALPDAQRWKAYQAVERAFEQLWRGSSRHKVVKRGMTTTFPSLPMLTLEDRNGDGKADFFAYGSADGKARSQEFGAFFDRNGDGRIDWLVYYGGMMMSGDGQFYFWHHHAVDTDGDGRFDIRIYTAVDADGDGKADTGATTWLEDADKDGLADRATRIVNGQISMIVPQGGAFPLGYVLAAEPAEQPKVGAAMPVQLMAAVAADIAALNAR